MSGYTNEIDSMFVSYYEVCAEPRVKAQSIDTITSNMLKVFIKENKATTFKELKRLYNTDFNDANNIANFNECIKGVKASFNLFFIDVYQDHPSIRKDLTEYAYLRYANKQFNEHLVLQVFKLG